jgi:tetratricopeptide (TPR) repeat protein
VNNFFGGRAACSVRALLSGTKFVLHSWPFSSRRFPWSPSPPPQLRPNQTLPLAPRTATNEGLAALQRGDPAARKQFETAIRLNPASAEAHNYLGWVLYTTGEIKPAITQFETAIRLKPSLAEAHVNLSAAFAQANDPPAATREARKAVALSPQSADAYHVLDRALELANDLDAATKAIQHPVELAPGRADLHDGFGSLLVRQNDLPTAIAQFQEAIRLSADFALAHFHLGVVYSNKRTTLALPPNSTAPSSSLRKIISPRITWAWRATVSVMRKVPLLLCRRP